MQPRITNTITPILIFSSFKASERVNNTPKGKAKQKQVIKIVNIFWAYIWYLKNATVNQIKLIINGDIPINREIPFK